jgi:hypothetical protein
MSFSETSKTVAVGKLVVVDGIEAVSGYPLAAPNGSVTAPSYSFSAQSGAGMYATSSGDMAMSVGGVNSWAISPSTNTTLAGNVPSDYGGGSGVTFIPEVSTTPGAAPNGGSGGLLYVSGTSMFYTNSLGTSINLSGLAGDVSGPGSSTDERAVLFSGTSGKIIQDSTLFMDTSGANPVVSLDGSNTPGAPRYGFLSDATSGMYRPSANTLGFSTSGTQRLQVNVGSLGFSVPLVLPNGNVSSPSIQFPDGGIYSTGGGNLMVANDGLTPMAINPGPNITVGGTTPNNYAGGEGVTLFREVTSAPSAATTGGISLYSEGTTLKGMTTGGNVIELSACLEGAASSTDTAAVRFDGASGDLIQDTPNVLIANTGEISAPDGSDSLPTYTFSTETGTGLYRVGADTLGVSTQGTQRIELSDTAMTSTVKMLLADGTAGSPAIARVGDVNSGWSLNGSSLSFSGNSNVQFSVSPNRNISLLGAEASSYGGGQGVTFINQALVDPTTNPTGAGLIYIPVGNVEQLAYRDTSGTVTILNSVIEGPASSTDRAVARWDGNSGRVFQNSSVTITAAGEMLSGDGSEGNPTYSFGGDTDTGMFLAGGNTLGVSVGGSETLTVSTATVSSGQNVDVPNGLVGAPSYSFISDATSGIYHPSADTVSFVAGGSGGLAVTLVPAASNSNVTLCSETLGYGGTTQGERVVKIDDVSVAPSGTASSGGRLYVSGTTINFHDDGGGDVDLANIVSGPASSTTNAMLRWDGGSGQLVKNSGVFIAESGTYIQAPTSTPASPTFSFTSTTTDGIYFPSSTSIAVSTSSADRLTISSAAVTTPEPVQADAGVEIGGGAGVNYSLAAANFISNLQTGTGTFAWANSTGPILNTSGLDLSFANNLVFTEGTETLTVGNNGTTYDLNSDGTTPHDLVISVGGTDIVAFNSTDNVDITGTVVTPGRVSISNSSTSTSEYSYSTTTLFNRGYKYEGGNRTAIGLGAAPGITFNEDNNVSWLGTVASSGTGGEGFIVIQNSSAAPTTTPAAGDVHMYIETGGGIYGLGMLTSAPLRSIFDAGLERAKITLTTSVTTATSTNVDGLTWTSVDDNGVLGTTTGRLVTNDDCFVGVTATAEWASDSIGYRRLSIMRRTAGPTYTRVNGVLTTAVNGDITAQTVYFFGSIAASTDELTVQVEQTSGGNLSVDLTMSFIRYETNVAP